MLKNILKHFVMRVCVGGGGGGGGGGCKGYHCLDNDKK